MLAFFTVLCTILLLEGLERRLWMTVYGVVAVILTQALQGILDYAPKGG